MSRIDPLMKELIGTENPDDLATEILNVLTEGSNIPQAGNYYVFVYKPKRQTKGYIREAYEYAKNQAKWKMAREFCADRQWEFKVVTEKELGI